MVAARHSLEQLAWPAPRAVAEISISTVLEDRPVDARPLPQQVIDCLTVWQSFLASMPADVAVPSFPIWSMEFGATYPFRTHTPYATPLHELQVCRGSHGRELASLSTRQALLQALPSHARTTEQTFPSWKVRFIEQNLRVLRREQTLDRSLATADSSLFLLVCRNSSGIVKERHGTSGRWSFSSGHRECG